MNTPTVRGETVFGPGSSQRSGAGNQMGGYDVTYRVPTGTGAVYGEGTIYAYNDFTVLGGGTLLFEVDITVGRNFYAFIPELVLTGNVNVSGSFYATNSNINTTSGSVGGPFYTINSEYTQGGGRITDIGGSSFVVNSDFEQSTRFVINVGGDLTVSNSNFVVGGALNVKGNYIQDGNSTLTIKSATDPSGPGVFNVGGHAQLDGVLQITIDSAPKRHDSVAILTAAGGVSGEFSSFNNPYPRQPGRLLYYDLNYEGQGVYLEAVQNDFKNALGIFNLTGNQQSTAAALDSALSDPRQDAVHTYLDGFDITAIPGILDLIAPEELGAIYSIGSTRMNSTVSSLQNRFAEIRSSGGNAFTVVKDMNSTTSSAKSTQEATILTAPARERFGSFTTASGDFSSSGDTVNAKGYDSEAGLLLTGFDARISDPLAVGALVGYARNKSDLNNGGAIEVDGGSLALYAQYVRNDWFLESMVGGSYNSYDTERQALNGIATGDTEGGELDTYLSFGRDLKTGGFTLTPFASLLYTRIGIDGYDETGSLQPLHIESQAADSLRSRIGVRVAKTFIHGKAVITPYASAQWEYEYLDESPDVSYRFANGAGGTSTAYGPEIGRHSLLVNGGLQVAWDRYACYLSYQTDLGRQNYENQTVLTGFRVSW